MRPKKPTALHELEGTFRKDRHNDLEPQPDKGLPDRPSWVDADPVTAQLFDAATNYIDSMNIATRVDGIAIGLLADQLGLYIKLRDHIREDGVIVDMEGSKGQNRRVANPAIPQLNQTLGNIHKLLREYGLTAASRSNVSVQEEKAIDSFDDFLG